MVAIDKLRTALRNRTPFGSSRKTRIVSATAIFFAVCAFGAAGVAPDAADLPVKSLVQELALPSLSEQIASLDPADQNYVSEDKVRPGDTLATLLNRLGVHDDAAAGFIKTDRTANGVLQLKAGKRVQVQTTASGALQWLSATVADGRDKPVKNIVIRREGSGFKALETAANLEKRVEMRSGDI
jgi:hypothetical protein